jgi:hypothetical protein
MPCRFTYAHYKEILQKFLNAEYRPTFFHQFSSTQTRQLLLRHDVDFIEENMMVIPTLEHTFQIKATYFFLIDSPFYNIMSERVQTILHELRQLGHEIGVHVDGSKINSSIELTNHLHLAYKLLGNFNCYSFHKPSIHDFTLNLCCIPSTYHPKFFKEIDYRSDSSMDWRGTCICQHSLQGQNIQLLIHTCWWSMNSDSCDRILDSIVQYNTECFQKELKKDLPFFTDNRFSGDAYHNT